MSVFLLDETLRFPPPELAERDGLLAVGGDLSPSRLLAAYRNGIFPWYSQNEPILWWSPDPRLVLFPSELHVSRSMKRVIRRKMFRITFDHAFVEVIRACAETRLARGEDTWITQDMIDAYTILHELGIAHSVEAWKGDELVGGLYGVVLGRVFFGESMFSKLSNSSKTAFITLVRYLEKWRFEMVDCQVRTDHLLSLGAREIPRKHFLKELERLVDLPTDSPRGKWDDVVI